MISDETDKTQLIEANTESGNTDHNLVAMTAKANGIESDDFIWKILESDFNE